MGDMADSIDRVYAPDFAFGFVPDDLKGGDLSWFGLGWNGISPAWRVRIEQRVHRYKNRIWQTREGEDIPMTEMSDRHLNNTISFLEREEHTDHPQYPHLVEEQKRREDERCAQFEGYDR